MLSFCWSQFFVQKFSDTVINQTRYFTINDDIDTHETKEKTGTDSPDLIYIKSNQKNNRKTY